TSDPEEAEAIIVARRMAIPAVEQKGTLLLEDVGVPLPSLGELVRGIEQISQNQDIMIAVIAHAGDGNTHPLLVLTRWMKIKHKERTVLMVTLWIWPSSSVAPSPGNMAWDASSAHG